MHLTMLIWKPSSRIFFHDPDRKSRHQAKALPLVSRSTSSVLPSRKDSASESSSPLGPNWGLGVLKCLCCWRTPSVLRFFSPVGSVSCTVREEMLLKAAAPGLSDPVKPPEPLLLPTLRADCIMSFLAKSKGSPVWSVRRERQLGLADKRTTPVKLMRRSQTRDSAHRMGGGQ